MRKLQPVSFNLEDVFENKLYMFAMSNGSYSKYVKRLIQRDMERQSRVVSTPATKKAPAQPNVIHGGTNALNGYILES